MRKGVAYSFLDARENDCEALGANCDVQQNLDVDLFFRKVEGGVESHRFGPNRF